MKERTQYKEKIYSAAGAVLAEVVIAPTSLRKFSLMSEDYVRLDFSVVTPVNIPVGSYIDDEIFGRFVVTTEQLPKYIKATASYAYELRLDAPYIAWGNFVHMLTAEVDGVRVRKEAEWTLTQNLQAHADEIVKELAVLFGVTYTVQVDTTAAKRYEAKTISYDGTSILEALTSIADEYETEWFVDTVEKVIYFGKVETSGDAIEFELNKNVEAMDIQRDRDKYANKLYVYGGTDNIPYSYGRKFILAGIQTHDVDGSTYYTGDHKVTPTMFYSKANNFSVDFPSISYDGRGSVPATSSKTFQSIYGKYNFSSANNKFVFPSLWLTERYTGDITATVYLRINGTEIDKRTHVYTFNNETFKGGESVDVPALSGEITLGGGDNNLQITLTWSGSVSGYSFSHYGDAYYYGTGISRNALNFDYTTGNKSDVVSATTKEGKSCNILFNPLGKDRYYYDDEGASHETPEWYYFAFCDATGTVVSAPTGFGSGSFLDIDDDGYVTVPMAFYSLPIDNPSSLVSVGATRLKLPSSSYPGGYILDGNPSAAETVEGVVCFDNVYPEVKLRITEIIETERKDHTEYEGESEKTDWNWTQFSFKAVIYYGVPFKFKKDYMLAGTLKARFLVPTDISANNPGDGFKLAGMTFEVEYDAHKDTFTIVRNEDFGALLPNDVLRPKVGDGVTILNWNPKALKSMGIISSAETGLARKAREYVQALNKAQFVFTCTMSTGFLFDYYGSRLRLKESGGSPLNESQGKALYTGNGFGRYGLVSTGQRVTVKHGALKSPVTSRVIGYEYKFDKPYDAPKLTIGETQAYSRLAQIEKEITIIK